MKVYIKTKSMDNLANQLIDDLMELVHLVFEFSIPETNNEDKMSCQNNKSTSCDKSSCPCKKNAEDDIDFDSLPIPETVKV